jgi:hypothetical protein
LVVQTCALARPDGQLPVWQVMVKAPLVSVTSRQQI